MLSVALISLSGPACVLPPPLESGQTDVEINSAPVILVSGPAELAFPGPIVLDRGDSRRLSLSIREIDAEDTLFVKLFVDYGIPTQNPAFASCTAPPGAASETLRVVDCPTAGLCNGIPDGDTTLHFLEAMVADRAFLPDGEGEPPFRALPDGAAFSFRAWLLLCNPESDG